MSTLPPYETLGPATNIVMTLGSPLYLADANHPDSTRQYRYVVVPAFGAEITVTDGGYETIYEIAAQHVFVFVRGDAAALEAEQPADTLHWYILRWEDRSSASGAASPVLARHAAHRLGAQRPMPSRIVTWGSLKDRYRL